MSELREMIKRHEGLRLKPYKCSAGRLTIGYGRNLTDAGITEREAEYLLDQDIYTAIQSLELVPFTYSTNTWTAKRFEAIIDMIFNLGFSKFMRFKKMLAAIEAKNWNLAADEMLDSKWARQVNCKGRVIELAEMVRSG